MPRYFRPGFALLRNIVRAGRCLTFCWWYGCVPAPFHQVLGAAIVQQSDIPENTKINRTHATPASDLAESQQVPSVEFCSRVVITTDVYKISCVCVCERARARAHVVALLSKVNCRSHTANDLQPAGCHETNSMSIQHKGYMQHAARGQQPWCLSQYPMTGRRQTLRILLVVQHYVERGRAAHHGRTVLTGRSHVTFAGAYHTKAAQIYVHVA